MIRTGKYVSGSATAEKTIEYSVILTGSIVLKPSAAAAMIETSNTVWKSGARLGETSLPHPQPKYWDTTYPFDSAVSSDAPKVAAKIPTSTIARPTLPSCNA